MTKFFLALAFSVSVFTLPWWAVFLIGILFLSQGGNPVLVLVGGFILDELYGAPILTLHGFSYLYTTLAVILAVASVYFRIHLFE